MNIQNLTDDETQSDEWEKIKDWAGGANKTPKHPIATEIERIQRRKPQKMDEGGVAGGDPTKLLGELAPLGTGMIAPSPTGSSMPPPQAPPMAPAPLQTPPATPVPPPPTPVPLPMAPAQSAPVPAPTDASYDKQASGILGGITPDTISQLMQSLNRSNAKGQIGAGIAGIGDAISKGVGRIDQNRMAETEANLKNRQEQALKTPEMMTNLGKERYGLSETLQAKDPNSPYSKVVQNSERPTLKKLGWTDQQIGKVPAVAIQDAVKNNLTYEDTQAKFGLEEATIKQTGAYQKGMLANTAANIANETQHARAEETQAERDQALKENQEAAKHYITHPFKAAEARSRLAGGSSESGKGHGIPDLGDTFNGEKVIGVKRIN